ncbi:tyrosine/serine protein phosphatase [Xylariaceae sp. FL0662B]|nr:tyrosine/serine protein phosphatase [Xylariaceae sp. FL0662B]
MSLVFDNILNFRDVGETVNAYVGKKIVREGVFYRSARPDEASSADRRKLKDELGIKTVVDLRTKTEHLKRAEKKRQADDDPKDPPADQPESDAVPLEEPVHIPGLRYLHIKVTGKRLEAFLLSQLSWWSYFKLIFLFLLGYRMQGVSLLMQEVLLPRGLVGLGLITMDESGQEIAEALRAFTEPASLPILVHCTQGKDRTGLVVALVLMLLDVSTDAIAHDYLLSRKGLETKKEAMLEEIREAGLPPEWGYPATDFITRIQEHVNTKYKGIDGYLDSIGFGSSERDRLIEAVGA